MIKVRVFALGTAEYRGQKLYLACDCVGETTSTCKREGEYVSCEIGGFAVANVQLGTVGASTALK
jgi:hypothetical protein